MVSQMQPAFSLESGRLFLRDFIVADFEAVHEYASSEAVTALQEWGPNSNDQTRIFIQSTIEETLQSPRANYNLAIVEKIDQNLVGGCALFIKNPGREAEIGFSLNPRFWSNGYATEAAQMLLSFAFKDLQIHRVFATCRPENLASSTVLRKLGMREEGCLRENKYIRGKWCDSLVFAILINEWQSE